MKYIVTVLLVSQCLSTMNCMDDLRSPRGRKKGRRKEKNPGLTIDLKTVAAVTFQIGPKQSPTSPRMKQVGDEERIEVEGRFPDKATIQRHQKLRESTGKRRNEQEAGSPISPRELRLSGKMNRRRKGSLGSSSNPNKTDSKERLTKSSK